MGKEKWNTIRDFIVKNCKIIFPVLLVAVVAVTVVIALNGVRSRQEGESLPEESSVQESQEASDTLVAEEVPLSPNTDNDIYTLVSTYYSAMGQGDTETMLSVCDEISENDLLYYEELSKYIDHYAELEIYTKQGPAEGSVVAYVYFKMGIVNYEEVPGYETLYICRREDGQLYIKNVNNFTEEEKEYIKAVNEQVDVVEFNNRVNVEYNELMTANPELFEYLGLLGSQVQVSVGEILAARNAESAQDGEVQEGTDQAGDAQEETPAEETPAASGPQYATATTTVNVRSSDSEQADRLGKVSGGTRVEVQEVRVNGWTKIVFEGQDGYIKSEYLQMEESAGGLETIGTVTATTNINVRSAASETADRLGMLPGGESLELIANENGWCKVNYNGQVGYVKADYVTQQ